MLVGFTPAYSVLLSGAEFKPSLYSRVCEFHINIAGFYFLNFITKEPKDI